MSKKNAKLHATLMYNIAYNGNVYYCHTTFCDITQYLNLVVFGSQPQQDV